MRWPSLSVPPLDDIVTKILEDSQADCDALSIDPFSCDPADSSAKSQSCSSDVFSYEGLDNELFFFHLENLESCSCTIEECFCFSQILSFWK
jgi:hypothetical protein